MSSFKRGMTPAAAPPPQTSTTHNVVGRTIARPAQPVQTRSPIITTSTPQQREPSRIIVHPAPEAPQHVRGMVVGNDGKPIRGLSQATIQAHKAQTEDATEQCQNCGRWVPPAHMKTIIPNAYNSNNPLKLCNAPHVQGQQPSCASLAYKDPKAADAKQIEGWKPSIPAVRFDRDTAAPYDARQRGVSISDLVHKDTYHSEREVDSRYKQDHLIGEGNWSGGGRAGHQVTSDSVAASRDRAARVRR